METKLRKNIIFVQYFEPYNFMANMGQLAVEITYTDGDTEMLTTKSIYDNVRGLSDFADVKEYYEFINFLIEKKIPRK